VRLGEPRTCCAFLLRLPSTTRVVFAAWPGMRPLALRAIPRTWSSCGTSARCLRSSGRVYLRLSHPRNSPRRLRFGRGTAATRSFSATTGRRPKRERDQRRGWLPLTEGKQVRPPFLSAICGCLTASHRIPVPTRNHVSCMAPSAAAFGPGTRQSAVSACWLRGVRGEPGARGRCSSGGSVVADVPPPASLGTAAQDCPLVGRSFVVG
jgi:hypothetical protein